MDSSRSNRNGYRILDFLDDEQMARLGDVGQRIKSWRVVSIRHSKPKLIPLPPCSSSAPEPVVFFRFLFVDDLALTVTRVESVLLLLSQLFFSISLAFSQKLDGQSAPKPYFFTHPLIPAFFFSLKPIGHEMFKQICW